MPRDKLHQSLNDLHEQLDAAKSVDAEAREHLRSVMGEIREVLDRSSPDARASDDSASEADSSGIIDRLRESVAHFEGEHPTLTQTVLELIATFRRL